MFDLVMEQARKAEAKRVAKINLVIGEMTGVVGDSVQFYFDFLSKGTIAEGSDADIVIWDPNKGHTISAKTHHMNVDYSMFEGMKIKGDAETVLSRGEVIVGNKKFLGKKGRGNFIKRDAYGSAWKEL